MNGCATGILNRESLIQRCIDKDHTAWAHFVSLYGGLISSSVYRKLDMMNLCSKRHEVPDIVQEIFLTIWEKDKLSSLRNTAFLLSWLIVIAKNTTVNYFRKRLNNKDVENTRSFEEKFLSDSAHSLKKDIESDETKEILKQEIAKLNQKQCLALKLSIYDYKKQKDIAGIMGVSSNTVASFISRAKTQVSKAMRESYAL